MSPNLVPPSEAFSPGTLGFNRNDLPDCRLASPSIYTRRSCSEHVPPTVPPPHPVRIHCLARTGTLISVFQSLRNGAGTQIKIHAGRWELALAQEI